MKASRGDRDIAAKTTAEPASARAFGEPPDPLRSPYALDRHRIIQSTAFRRLEGKTQVFAPSCQDHFRTRLTHTIEVSQLARLLAVRLGANEELAEAIALAHDLGHPPFGHAGEAALDRAMTAIGGFNHNTHALRVVAYLEHPFPAFRGLNLTAATRAGLANHKTRYDHPNEPEVAGDAVSPCASMEAQLVSLADRIAYSAHDLEDALGAGLLGHAELSQVALWTESLTRTGYQPVDNVYAVRRTVLDGLVDALVADAITHMRAAFRGACTRSHQSQTIGALSEAMEAKLVALEDFLAAHVYAASPVKAADELAVDIVSRLFDALVADASAMPERFRKRIPDQGAPRVVGDYIAGMTDRFCEKTHDHILGKQ
ncbi:MAG: dGTP triphosphohydrolase [Phycisphaerae bacterium]